VIYTLSAYPQWAIRSAEKRNNHVPSHIDKKEKKIFLIYEEIQNGAVAKSYMTNGLLIYA
jgi:hypothetical protein